MCSKDRKEVEAVKSELFRNGIRSEIRNNPVAEALRVSRVELWLQDECDYFKATKLYTAIQERGNSAAAHAESSRPGDAEPEAAVYIDAEEIQHNSPAHRAKKKTSSLNSRPGVEPAVVVSPPASAASAPAEGVLDEVSGLLEKDIEDLLARDAELNARCASQEIKMLELKESLAAAESRAAVEVSARTAAEEKIELQRHELKEQQTLTVALRNELVAREQNLKELGETLRKAGVELGTERQARESAEARLSECAVARANLEQQVAAQTEELHKVRAELQARDAQMQAYVGRLNNIRSRLQR